MAVTTSKEIEVEVSNIGGIEQATVPFNSGTVAFVGENATNRTSFLTALNAALGGSRSNLRTDSDEGYVSLQIDDSAHRRTVERVGNDAQLHGDPYCENETLVDLYATLLEDNPIRTAVRSNQALRDILMEPVDLNEIDRELRRLRRDKKDLKSDLKQAKRKADKESDYRKRLNEKQSEQAELQDQIDEVTAEINDITADVAEVEAIEAKREELDEARDKLSTAEEKLDYHKREKENLETELDELDVPTEGDLLGDTSLDDLRESKRQKNRDIDAIENQLDTLQSLISTAETVVGDEESLFDSVDYADDSADVDHVTDVLSADTDDVNCPLCGTGMSESAFVDHVETLQDMMKDRRGTRDRLQSEIDELRSNIASLESKLDEKRRLEDRQQTLEQKIEHHTEKIEEFNKTKTRHEQTVEQLKTEISEIEVDNEELPELHEKQSDLTYELGQVEGRIETLQSNIEDASEAAEAVDELERRIEEVNEEIHAKQSYIKDTELGLVDDFNEQMEQLLDELNYDNLERVWLERRAPENAGPHDASFELHIVREGEDGSVYEDTVDTLSESEREIVGLILAVAGYEAHNVGETCPFMLLDSVESIDAERIEKLLSHVSETADTLCVALLPEDAEAVDAVTETVSAELLS